MTPLPSPPVPLVSSFRPAAAESADCFGVAVADVDVPGIADLEELELAGCGETRQLLLVVRVLRVVVQLGDAQRGQRTVPRSG